MGTRHRASRRFGVPALLAVGCSAAAAPVTDDDPAHAVPIVRDFASGPEVFATADAFRFQGGVMVERFEIGPAPLVAGQPATIAMDVAGVRGDVMLRVGLTPPRSGSRQVAVGGVDAPPPIVPADPRAVTAVVPAPAGHSAQRVEVPLVLSEPWHPEHALVGLELSAVGPAGSVRIEAIAGPRTHNGVALLGLVPVATVPTRVTAVRAQTAPTIDGVLSEPIWTGEGTTLVDSLHGEPWPEPSTRAGAAGAVHLAWDAQALYAAASFRDRDVWATMTQHDDPLWKEEVFELFVFGEPGAQRYLELQVSPRGVTFDAKFEAYRKGQEDWDSQWATAVDLRGTLDDRKDRDEGWSVEVAVPWSEICAHTETTCPPAAGSRLRINAFRFERPHKKDPVGLSLSPTRVPDFHASANAAILELLP